MSDKQTERIRRFRDFDDDFEERPARHRRRQLRPETKYVYRVNGAKPPTEVYCERGPKLGDVLSTSSGPHKVVEVFWSGDDRRGWKADVLLRPLTFEEKKDWRKDAEKRPARRQNQGSKLRNRNRQGRQPRRRQNVRTKPS
jgi:hypothetical protein